MPEANAVRLVCACFTCFKFAFFVCRIPILFRTVMEHVYGTPVTSQKRTRHKQQYCYAEQVCGFVMNTVSAQGCETERTNSPTGTWILAKRRRQ